MFMLDAIMKAARNNADPSPSNLTKHNVNAALEMEKKGFRPNRKPLTFFNFGCVFTDKPSLSFTHIHNFSFVFHQWLSETQKCVHEAKIGIYFNLLGILIENVNVFIQLTSLYAF